MKRANIARQTKSRPRVAPQKKSPAEQLRRISRARRVISQVNQILIRATTESELLYRVCRVIAGKEGYRLAWVGYGEPDGNKTVRPVAQAGFEQGYLEGLQISWAETEHGRGPTGTAIRTGKLSIARNIKTEPRFAPWRAEAMQRGYRSSIALPLIADRHTFGALNIYATEADAFDSAEVKLLTELADDLAYGITALREREALRHERDLTARIAETSPVGITLLNRDGQITFANTRAEQVLGLTKDEITQRTYNAPVWHITDYDGNPFPDEELPFRRVMSTGKPVSDVHHAIVWQDGRRVLLSINAAPLLDASGQVDGMVATVEDVTAHKRAAEALRESEERYRVVTNMISDYACSVRIDPNHKIVWEWETKPYSELTGYTIEEIKARGGAHSIIHPDDASKIPHIDFDNLKPTVKEYRIITKGGEVRWLRDYQKPVWDEAQGRMVRIYGVTQDITERKRAEEALRESEQRYRNFISHSSEGIYRIDMIPPVPITLPQDELVETINRQAIVGEVNEALATMYGLRIEDMVGRRATDFAPNYGARAILVLQSDDHKVEHEETRDVDRDGNDLFLMESYHGEVSDGLLRRIWGVQRDITERKRAEEALRESEAKYRTLFETSTDAIFVETLEGKVLDCNDAACKMLGYSKTALTALTVADLVPQQVAQTLPTVITEELTTGGIFIEAFNQRENGAVFPCEVSTRVVTLGREPRVFAYVRDITERKRAEEEIHHRADEFSALYNTARDLAAEQDLPTLLDTIAERARQLLGTSISEVCLYDPARNDLELVIAKGYPPPNDRRVQMGEGMAGKVAQTRQPMFMSDYHAWSGRSMKYEEIPISSSMQVPMLDRGELIGVIGVGDIAPQSHQFTDADTRLLSLFAAQAASAVHAARLDEETRRRLAELEAVNRISTALRTAQTLDEMLPLLLDETLKIMNTDTGILALYDETSGVLHRTAARGWMAVPTAEPLRPGEGIMGLVFSTGEPCLSRELTSDARTRESKRTRIPSGWGAAGIPIRAAQEIIGVFFISVPLPREFTSEEVRLLSTLAEIAGNAIHRTRLHEQTEQQLQRLAGLHTIDQTISASLDLRLTFNVLLDQVVDQLRAHAAAILLLKLPTQTLEYAAGRGFRSNAIARSRLRIDDGSAGCAARERRTIHIPNLLQTEGMFARAQLLAGEQFVTYFAAPLIAKGQVKGVLELYHRAPLQPDRAWLEYLDTLARQAAIAIDNTEMFEMLQRSNIELMLAYDTTLEGWSRALELRDYETQGHSKRVVELTLRLARALHFTDAELVQLRRGALLHDIGKLAISDTILLKREPLTQAEQETIHQHPIYAHDLLSPVTFLRPSLDIPYCHHEKWDGTGYPRALKGEQIPLAARLFAFVDVWDAMRSDRPYRTRLPDAEARAYIQSQAGKHFDPQIVELFLRTTESE